jgi:preprotein translocase subunit Sec63
MGETLMKTFNKINEARKLLQLPEQATLAEVKTNYRNLIKKYHPDHCPDADRRCTEMTIKLNKAYRIILSYCTHYRFSFAREEVQKYVPSEEWWLERFGRDPLWGKNGP